MPYLFYHSHLMTPHLKNPNRSRLVSPTFLDKENHSSAITTLLKTALIILLTAAMPILSSAANTDDDEQLDILLRSVSGKSSKQLLKANKDQLLDSLDYYLSLSDKFEKIAINSILRDKRNLRSASTTDRLMLYENIGYAYMHINLDSAILYLNTGTRLANENGRPREAMRMYLYSLQVSPLKGLNEQTIKNYQNIDVSSIDPRDLKLYYETGRQIYNFAADTYTNDTISRKFRLIQKACTDSLIKSFDTDSHMYKYYKAANALMSPDADIYKLGRNLGETILSGLSIDNHDFAVMAANMGIHYLSHNDREQAERYLAMSAISDIINGNGETTSLHRLGKLLYADKETERAYNYLTYSLQRSVSTGARIRTIEVAEALPLVIETSNRRGDSNQTLTKVIVVILTCLLLTMTILFIFAIKHRRHLMRLRKRLADSHQQKDDYIRELLSLCAGYLNTIDNLNLLTARKIKAGQISDLLSVVESGRALREPQNKFFEVFDRDFLHLYPDFIKEVNALLESDKQLILTDEKTLTPELRILAFMRLGVDDSAKISRFLGLSLNTVYTYRNKVKNRAKNRESFDNDIRNIGKIE